MASRLKRAAREQAYPNRVRRVWGKMVAEEGFQQYHHSGFRRKWPTCSTWHEILNLIHRLRRKSAHAEDRAPEVGNEPDRLRRIAPTPSSAALSRRKQGFESPRERQSNQALFQFRKGPKRSPPIIDLSSNPNAATLGQHARTSAKTVAGFHSAAGRTFSRRLSAQVSASRGRSGLHGTLRHHSGRAEVCR